VNWLVHKNIDSELIMYMERKIRKLRELFSIH
jgi:hypothetical protein